MVEIMKKSGKSEIFDAAKKQLILQAIKNGFVVQVQDTDDVEEYVAYDIATRKPVIRVRENYASGRSTVMYNDQIYTKRDHRYVNGEINHRLTDAESVDSPNSINESDFSEIYRNIASIAVKVR